MINSFFERTDMTTIMNQVTCSLCNMKTDELKWNGYLVSENHLELRKYDKVKTALNFFEMIFSVNFNQKELKNLEIKAFDFWQSYF